MWASQLSLFCGSSERAGSDGLLLALSESAAGRWRAQRVSAAICRPSSSSRCRRASFEKFSIFLPSFDFPDCLLRLELRIVREGLKGPQFESNLCLPVVDVPRHMLLPSGLPSLHILRGTYLSVRGCVNHQTPFGCYSDFTQLVIDKNALQSTTLLLSHFW